MKGRRKKDREMMEALGREEMQYSNDYFERLSQPSTVGENLPTESCEKCGAALDPGDVFCSRCGEKSWGMDT